MRLKIICQNCGKELGENDKFCKYCGNSLNVSQTIINTGASMECIKFEAQIYSFKKEEGGRLMPFYNNYKPLFVFNNQEFYGTIILPDGVELVQGGDKLKVTVEVEMPVTISVGQTFNMNQSTKTIGNGVVINIIE